MPREVFAEEIEAFLERLDAVGAVRIVATEAGEIDRVYVTAEGGRDDGTVRRAITAALMSRFNLHVDGWRVHVAHLEPAAPAEPVPQCRLIRLDETITETTTRVHVELGYERDGVGKTADGAAQAPPGPAHRARAVALATLAALRPLLERGGVRAGLEGLMFMPFAGATVALVGVSLTLEQTTVVRVGSETVAGGQAEAVVGAVLDAVRKPSRELADAARRSDRWRRLDDLRRHYEGLVRAAADAPPAPEGAPVEGAPPVTGAPASPEPPSAPPAPAETLAQIRPEREGGASVVTREEIRGDGPPAGRGAPRVSMEDAFYRRLVASGVPVHIRCRDGYEIAGAVIRDFGTYSLLVDLNGVAELVFKHGIIAIRPTGPLPAEPPVA